VTVCALARVSFTYLPQFIPPPNEIPGYAPGQRSTGTSLWVTQSTPASIRRALASHHAALLRQLRLECGKARIPRRRHRLRLARHAYILASDTRDFLARILARVGRVGVGVGVGVVQCGHKASVRTDSMRFSDCFRYFRDFLFFFNIFLSLVSPIISLVYGIVRWITLAIWAFWAHYKYIIIVSYRLVSVCLSVPLRILELQKLYRWLSA